MVRDPNLRHGFRHLPLDSGEIVVSGRPCEDASAFLLSSCRDLHPVHPHVLLASLRIPCNDLGKREKPSPVTRPAAEYGKAVEIRLSLDNLLAGGPFHCMGEYERVGSKLRNCLHLIEKRCVTGEVEKRGDTASNIIDPFHLECKSGTLE